MAVSGVQGRSASGRALSPITQRLIRLAPGERLRVPVIGSELDAERSRMSSRIKTATLTTGHRYRIFTEGRRLYVVCEAVTEER